MFTSVEQKAFNDSWKRWMIFLNKNEREIVYFVLCVGTFLNISIKDFDLTANE